MSGRGAEGAGGNEGGGGEASERRGGGVGQRVRFEALVAVGDVAGGAGFEAESVDVSPEGMRLRTAYLPQVGDKLMCRFDGAGGEVSAVGEVCWRSEAARGGEFGLRFAGLEPAAEQTVRSLCAALGVPSAPAPAQSAGAGRGARVRLHIDGLGSPMKARVRGSGSEDVEVGSNLEFLKVGRTLELEDVDRGGRRDAYIDTVKVEVDPATSIPQLVVTLRYDAPPKAPRAAAAAPAASAASALAAKPAPQPRAEPERAAAAGAPAAGSSAEDAPGDDELDASPALDAAGAGARDPDGADEASPEPAEVTGGAATRAAKLRGAGEKAARAGLAAAGRIGPAIAGAGARARGAMEGLLARIQKRRAERAEAQKAAGPRRMTAPPPTGALKSEGRRLVREDGDDAPASEPPPEKPRMNKRAAAMGSLLGLAAVLAIFGAARYLGIGPGAAAPAAQAPAAAPALPPAPTAAVAAAAPAAAGEAPGGALTANVPLFGATPLSTTEPVPPPPDPNAAAAAAPGVDPNGAPGDPAVAAGDEPGIDDGQSDPKSWGQGTVKHPIVLKLKMDGPVDQINGASGAMGFTVSLPDRRALSSGTGLARKDKRIASVRVVNTPHGAEVTLQFKDGVPAYLARANGDRLEIALGNDEAPKKVAAKKKGDAKAKKAKKDDKGKAKKADGKKADGKKKAN